MKRYTVRIAHRIKKQADSIPSEIKIRIGTVIGTIIAENPHIGKPLKADLKGLYSYRVGDYRIIYSILNEKDVIEIVKIMHRREVYRR